MSVLWCGGEDVDFVTGTVSVGTNAGNFRTGYARCYLTASSGVPRSNPFPGGAITSCWFTFRVAGGSTAALKWLGLTDSTAAGAGTGIWIGSASAAASKLCLAKFDGTTRTELATESGTSIASIINRVDVQVVNYGATATINVWLNGALLIAYSGDPTVSGTTTLDSISISGSGNALMSEFIVADEDLRAWPGLLTMALTGAGTTDQWTGVYSTINGTTISDASPNYDNTNGHDQQFNVTDPPSGTFTIKAVKIAARMAKSASPAVTQVKLGYNSGGTVAFGTGATKALTTAYATYEQLDAVNPVTGNAFTQAEITALQLDMQSVT